MSEPLLAIQLITYNRAAALSRTLDALASSPFARCDLTIFDNASTDETPVVVARHAASFARFEVVRHRKNIGVSANYLRAAEASRGRYTWILCDDDEYDMSAADEILSVLGEGGVDGAWLGPTFAFGTDASAAGASAFHDGRARRLSEIRRQLGSIYYPCCFLPTLAFRTDLFTAACLHRGYLNAPHVYPQFPFVASLVESDALLHVVSRQIVRMGGVSAYPSQLYWRWCWLSSCLHAPTESERRAAMLEPSGGDFFRLLRSFAGDVLEERARRPGAAADLAWRTWAVLPAPWRLLSLPLAAGAWLPSGACRLLARSRLRPAPSFDDPFRL